MTRMNAEQLAMTYSEAGFHCAEAVAVAVTELFCHDQTETACRMATGFGGGLGGSRAEACGALTGGVLAIGLLCGRTTSEQSRDEAYRVTTAYRDRFMARFGATICQPLRDGFGTADIQTACRSLTAEAAGILHDVLLECGYTEKTS